ncbi:MAG: hypothetical protein EBY39_09530 [Flavobacteriia bacterium]|nr:hypothetical protein [Flavobacteriia bacterium]
MEILSNVGIGTTSPSVKLDVIGRGKFDSLIGNNGLTLASNGTNNLNLYNGILGSTAELGISIASGGNVGIGTTGPDAKLDLRVSSGHPFYIRSGTGVNDNLFLFENPTSGTDGPQFSMYERGTANIKVRLSTHDDSYFNGGNVGIGTTSADAKLDVHGLGYFRTPAGGALISSWTTGASTQENQPVLLLRRADENNNAIALNSDGNSYFNGGNVGIGTTNPASTLHILGSFGAPATSNSIIRFAQSSGNGLCDLGFMAAGTKPILELV